MNKKVIFALFVVLSFALMASSVVIQAPASSPREPKQRANFRVEIEGVYVGSALSVEGMGMEIDVIEYREGDDAYIKKTNGLTHGGPLVLRRTYDCYSDEWWRWFHLTQYNEAERKSMSIIFDDKGNMEGCRFNFFECWPSKYYIEPMESQGNDVVVEVIEIQFEFMEWA